MKAKPFPNPSRPKTSLTMPFYCKLLTILCILVSFFQGSYACTDSDYINVIGSDKIDVHTVRAMPNHANDHILVAGELE